MKDRIGQTVEIGDYIWYNTKTRFSYLNLGRVESITVKPATPDRFYRSGQTIDGFRAKVMIKVQVVSQTPSLLEEWTLFSPEETPEVKSNRFLLATPEQVGRELVRLSTPAG